MNKSCGDPFNDPDPFRELRFPSILAAKLAIADYLARPLAKLAAEDLGYIEALLKETLERRTIITACGATSATVRSGSRERMVSMRAEVMGFCGLTRSPRAVGYFETTHHRQLLQDIKQAVYDGDLVALCGVVGAGKTVMLRRHTGPAGARESGNRGEVDLRREEPGHAGYTDHGAVL